MKKLFVVLLFFMLLGVTKAQDRIITVQKDTIECHIMSVGPDRINYEQQTSGKYLVGKSIAISDVYQYFRVQQSKGAGRIDQPITERKKPERCYLIGIKGGLAHSFTDFTDFRNMMTGSGVAASEIDDYIGKLKNGFHINAEFYYLLTTYMGIGVDYSLFYSASQGDFLFNGYGGMNLPFYVKESLNEKLYTHFVGPSVYFRQLGDRKGKIKISETLSPGIVFFRGESRGTEYQIYWDDSGFYSGNPPMYFNKANAVIKSLAFGVKAGFSVEYCVSPQLSAGLAGNFTWAKLHKATFKDFISEMKDQKLENAINVSHINYGFTVRYNF
ncbi:MAG: hypothetical protein JXP36_14915 [Bacteroidales bacterium]|nr:hypothetical protein [Bacteroidales bacterium]